MFRIYNINEFSIKRVFVFIAPRFVSLVILFIPVFAYANLIPCNNTFDQAQGKFTDPCGFSTLVTLGNNIINFLWRDFAAPFAVVLFMWAGFLFMFKSGSSSDLSKAKGIFWNVVVGFIITLAAFLIIKFLLVGLGVGSGEYRNVLSG